MPSLRRRRSVATAGPEPQPAPVAVDRPRGEWASLPPVGTVAARPASAVGVVPHRDFRGSLATMWSAPPALQPLAHDLTPSAPAGLITAHAAPITAYDGAPLRFAPALPRADDPATPVSWTLSRQPDAAPAVADVPAEPAPTAAPARPGLLDRLLGRTPSPTGPGESGPAAAGARRTTAAAPASPSATSAQVVGKSAEEQQPATVVTPLPSGDATPPAIPSVRSPDPVPTVAPERRGPGRAAESTPQAGPRRSRPVAEAESRTADRSGPAPTGNTPGEAGPLRKSRAYSDGSDALAVVTAHPAAADDGEDQPPVQALFPGDDGATDGRRAAVLRRRTPEGRPSPSDRPNVADRGTDGEPAARLMPADDDHTDGQERSGPAPAVDSTGPAGPLRSRRAPDGDVAPDGFVPTMRYVEPEPRTLRPLVGRRPLGENLREAVRGAAPARPVAGFVPATLPDPVQPREAVERRGAAPARPALPGADGGPRRPWGSDNRGDDPPYAATPGDTQTEPSDPPAATSADLPPGLPDWWPSDSGSWSVRDVDPFRASPAEPAPPDEEPSAPDLAAPAVAPAPAIQQRIRPTRDPASGSPVTRRVPFPGLPAGEGPALRQVRRPRPAAPAPAAHLQLDPHLPVLDRDPVVEAPLDPVAVPSTSDGTSAPSAASTPAPAPTRGPAAPAAMTAEEVADHVRHALLVERERSGALADQW